MEDVFESVIAGEAIFMVGYVGQILRNEVLWNLNSLTILKGSKRLLYGIHDTSMLFIQT
jgi:hypothetical protein